MEGNPRQRQGTNDTSTLAHENQGQGSNSRRFMGFRLVLEYYAMQVYQKSYISH